jgi:hypothetical protein
VAYLYLVNISEIPIYFLVQDLEVKDALFVSEYYINLCVLQHNQLRIFSFLCEKFCGPRRCGGRPSSSTMSTIN